MQKSVKPKQSFTTTWVQMPSWIRVLCGLIGSLSVLILFWEFVLRPLAWPPLTLVTSYFWESIWSIDTYKAFLMTGVRALVGMFIGFGLAVTLAILTGRTIWGWCAFFFLLLAMQKIPAIAMVRVLVSSKLGIGFTMTTVLTSTVVMTFTWLVLHHRAATLDPKEIFALRVVGFKGWQLGLYGLLPHMGSAIGGAARLAMSISIVMVILGEWQGIWSDGSLWEYGLGVQISRYYEAIDSEARILASCLWLGLLGLLMDSLIQAFLQVSRLITGVDLKR
jgi:ABC-type nitrate/sulfonate/bicarbonate transport system permease component